MAQMTTVETNEFITALADLIEPTPHDRETKNFTGWLNAAEVAGLISHDERGHLAKHFMAHRDELEAWATAA